MRLGLSGSTETALHGAGKATDLSLRKVAGLPYDGDRDIACAYCKSQAMSLAFFFNIKVNEG